MILKEIEYEGERWMVCLGPQSGADGEDGIELLFVRREGDGRTARYAWPMHDREVLEALARDANEISDSFLQRILRRAVEQGRTVQEG